MVEKSNFANSNYTNLNSRGHKQVHGTFKVPGTLTACKI